MYLFLSCLYSSCQTADPHSVSVCVSLPRANTLVVLYAWECVATSVPAAWWKIPAEEKNACGFSHFFAFLCGACAEGLGPVVAVQRKGTTRGKKGRKDRKEREKRRERGH